MRYGLIFCEVSRVGCPRGTDGRRKHLCRCDVLSFRTFVRRRFLFRGFFFCCCDSLEEIQSLDCWTCIVGFGCRVGNILGLRSHRCTLGYKIVAQLLALWGLCLGINLSRRLMISDKDLQCRCSMLLYSMHLCSITFYDLVISLNMPRSIPYRHHSAKPFTVAWVESGRI